MRKMLIGILYFFCFTGCHLFAQNISYRYDNSGNRIERKLIELKSSSKSDGVDQQEEIFEESLPGLEIKIYPNPTEGHLMVTISPLDDAPEGKITITKLDGRMVLTKKVEGPSTSLNLSDQPTGYYIMTIAVGTETSVWKILKK